MLMMVHSSNKKDFPKFAYDVHILLRFQHGRIKYGSTIASSSLHMDGRSASAG